MLIIGDKISNKVGSKRKLHLVLAAGGTGGHVFPAQAIAEVLNHKYELSLVTNTKALPFIKGMLTEIPKVVLPIKSVTGSINNKLWAVILLLVSIVWVSVQFMVKRPNAVITFGGYSCLPAALAAYILRIPVVVHEQNAVMGRANCSIARYIASKVALSFRYTRNLPKGIKDKTIYTGNPIRNLIISTNSVEMNDSTISKCWTILAIGGSQGASLFSRIIPHAIQLLPAYVQRNVCIYQQSRRELMEYVLESYGHTQCKFYVAEFFDNIAQLMVNSSIVISRAGASTISELVMLKVPSILVPYARAADNHQYHNAKFLSDNGAALLITEDEFNAKQLSVVLSTLIESPRKLKYMRAKLHTLNREKNSAVAFANVIKNII